MRQSPGHGGGGGKTKPKPNPNKRNAHAAVEAEEPGDKKKMKCFICDDDHRVKECPKFLSSTNREALLREYKLSIYCLGHKFNFK